MQGWAGPMLIALWIWPAWAAAQQVPAGGEAGFQRIEATLGSGACTRDEQCRVIGVGARSCGGPEDHRAYSVLDVDEQRLRRLVAQHAELRLQAQQRAGEMSTCQVLPEPGVRCDIAPQASRGRCALVPARVHPAGVPR